MFTKMLVPLDGSEISEGILPWVAQVAKGLDMPVTLLSIVDPSGPMFQEEVAPPGLSHHMGRLPLLTLGADRLDSIGTSQIESPGAYPDSGGHPSKKEIEEISELDKWLRESASTLEAQGVEILEEKIVSQHENASQAIVRAAGEHGCDVVAMATHGRNLLERTFRGSVTYEVIRSAEFPVLAISPEEQSGLPNRPAETVRLLVMLDGSDFAESVLPYVKELGLRLSLEVVLVRWLTSAQEYSAPIARGEPLTDDVNREGQPEPEAANEATAARRYLQSIAADLEGAGLKVRWEIPEAALNSPGFNLSELCAGSIILLASHGRSGWSRWIEGSVAEDLLRGSGCPVLIIPSVLANQGEDDGGQV